MEAFKEKFITKEELPLVLEPKNKAMSRQEFFEILKTQEKYIKDSILKHGGILLRNCPLENEQDFSSVIKTLKLGPFVDYIGGDSPRNKVADGIYTSTEAPPSVKIPLHNELSFVNNFPKYICFFCQIASSEGGATILGDARRIYKAMDESIKSKFTKKNLKYVSCYYGRSELMEMVNRVQRSHKSWRQVFETDNKQEVENLCKKNDFKFHWNKNDWLEISQTRPAVIEHPQTKEKVWFNQVHLYDFNPRLLGWWRYLAAKVFYCRKYTRLHEIFFADNTKIPRNDIYKILDILDANTVSFQWQKGDLLILDNILTMHGRATFSGKRRILTAMTG